MSPSAADSENKAVAPIGDQKPAQAPTSPAASPAPAKSAAAPVEPAGSSLTGAGAAEGESAQAPETPEIKDRRKSSRTPVGGVERRNSVVDRRAGIDRRVVDIGSPTGLERRRGPGRRREENRRSAEEGEMNDEQFEFVLAINTYKRLNHRPFPSWTEVLEVIKQLGYRKVAPSQLSLPNGNKTKNDNACAAE